MTPSHYYRTNSESTSGAVSCYNQGVALEAGLGVSLGLALLSVALLAHRVLNLRNTRKDQIKAPTHKPNDKASPAGLGGHGVVELPGSRNSEPGE
jgi:hypothetical protein